MSNILIVIGSARTGRVADKVLEYVEKDINARETVTATIADLKEINLPFFDSEVIPASPDYNPTNEQVVVWKDLVSDADAVLFITPEYNHALSAIQKNAIDSLYGEWDGKTVSAVAYGWSGGSLALESLRIVLDNVKADLKQTTGSLAFMKAINPDGTIIDETTVSTQVAQAIDSIL